MPQNTLIVVPANTPTLLTDATVTALTFQVSGGFPIRIQGTVGATPPSTWGPTYNSGQGEANRTIADLFPGVSGANRVYAYAEIATTVWVSHA
jgi:hypothetical protein